MLVHINKAVAFAVLAGGERNAVDAAPRRVAQQIHAVIRHRFHHLLNVGAQIIDAVIVINAAVRFHIVISAKAIFHDEQRLLITLVKLTQRVTQADRVNLPAPVRRFHMRVWHATLKTAERIAATAFGFNGVGHVIAETQIIAAAFTQNRIIARFHLDVKAATLPLVQHVRRVIATQLHIGKHITLAHRFLRIHHVFGLAGERVERHHRQHAADFHHRVNTMADFHRHGACHELMMQHLVHRLFRVVVLGVDDAGTAVAKQRRAPVALVIDLIKGHPVFDLIFVALEHHLGEADKEIHHFAVRPAAILLHQMQRHFKVREGNYRLNVVFQQLIKHIVIELEPRFIGLRLIAVGENSRPGDRRAETLKAHFGEEFNIFFIMSVKIDGFMVRVIFARHDALRNFTRYAMRAAGQHVTNAWPFAALVPAAFYLMRRDRAAP
ncbi:hypothetical protein BN132_1660 [Cronobacter turicensis 564]|nr:hypothetical protein BN132_1660 [Cronobacter turicensis 564]